MSVPYVFGTVPNGNSIPLSWLDANFQYVINSPSFTGNVTISGTLTVSGHVTFEGVTSTGATGTGNLVYSNSPTLVTPNLGTPTSGTLTNCTGLPVAGISGLGSGVSNFLATPSSSNLASAVTDETGSGSLVFATSPTLVTPILGTPASGTLTNCTGLPVSTGISGLGSGVSSFLATPSSANLATAVTDETGSGSLVFATSPTLVTPLLGTPTSGTLTNCTGLPISTGVSGLATGIASFLATPSSANLAAAVTNETGSGALVFGTSPTITTPGIVGVTDASNATAGNVGEVIQQNVLAASAVSLTTNTTANVTSISLTAGDWDVTGTVAFSPAATTSVSAVQAGINTTSATLPTAPSANGFPYTNIAATLTAGAIQRLSVSRFRVNVSTTTTVYLVAQSTFATSTMGAFGSILARRVR